MTEIKWSPYIPIFPNSQIPQVSRKSEIRVVEPSTRSSVKMTPLESWDERIEKLRSAHRNAIILRYTKTGDRVLTSVVFGSQLVDFSI